MSLSGTIHVTSQVSISYFRNDGSYYAGVWINGSLLTIDGKPAIRWYKVSNPIELENTIMNYYSKDIKLVLEFQKMLTA